jgi:hypothetical protein
MNSDAPFSKAAKAMSLFCDLSYWLRLEEPRIEDGQLQDQILYSLFPGLNLHFLPLDLQVTLSVWNPGTPSGEDQGRTPTVYYSIRGGPGTLYR